MALKLYPYALTSLANVKNRLSITNTGWDDFLTRLINRWTDYIERQCGNRSLPSGPRPRWMSGRSNPISSERRRPKARSQGA